MDQAQTQTMHSRLCSTGIRIVVKILPKKRPSMPLKPKESRHPCVQYELV